MSEPLVGGAGTASPDPARFGRDRDQEPAMEAPGHEWAPGQHDDRLDGDGAHGEPERPVVTADGPAVADGAVPAADGAVVSKVSRRRRRGSRGGRGRHSPAVGAVAPESEAEDDGSEDDAPGETSPTPLLLTEQLPAQPEEVTAEVAPRPAVRPKIGDTRPGSPPAPRRRVRKDGAPAGARAPDQDAGPDASPDASLDASLDASPDASPGLSPEDGSLEPDEGEAGLPGARARRSRRRRGEAGELVVPAAMVASQEGDKPVARSVGAPRPTTTSTRAAGGASASPLALDRAGDGAGRRTGAERARRPLGRYLMVVHVGPTATQIAVLEGRTLIEHYVSRPADDATQIDGNIYLGRVQNVLPGMEAAFVDIGTPKNAVLYRGDLRYDDEEVERPVSDEGPKPTRGRLGGAASDARIEQLLRTGQSVICQVTKNPIGTKGARLTQEVSLPGRFVVLIPDSETYGISKRLGDDERRRLRKILDDVRPEGHGLIVRTAAEGASAEELSRDVSRLLRQWEQVQEQAKVSRAPQLLYREPDLAVRVIREEFNRDYRGVVIDDPKLYDEVKEYVTSITPELAERVELVGPDEEPLPLFERFRVHEQVHKALDRKVWLPSGGSIIIERTEALTVIDVNTGKNVGTSNLEETVFRNNLEAAEEISRQLRLRDIGGIIVIDFIDMDVAANRAEVIRTFREALAHGTRRAHRCSTFPSWAWSK